MLRWMLFALSSRNFVKLLVTDSAGSGDGDRGIGGIVVGRVSVWRVLRRVEYGDEGAV